MSKTNTEKMAPETQTPEMANGMKLDVRVRPIAPMGNLLAFANVTIEILCRPLAYAGFRCVRRGYGYSGKYCRNPRQPGIPVSERAGCFCPGTAAKCGSGSAGMSGCGETGTRFRCTVMGRKLYYDGRCIDALCTCTKGFNQS